MIRLRDLTPEDRDMIREWRNLPKVANCMFSDHVITPVEHAAWFARILKDTSCKYWIIVCDGEDVGVANLYKIDFAHLRCYFGFYVVGPNVRGKGVWSFAEYLILNYVFEELNLEKLCTEVLASNAGVCEMHRRFFGFVDEGVLRKHILKKGTWHDVVSQSILKEEWRSWRPKTERWLRVKGLLV